MTLHTSAFTGALVPRAADIGRSQDSNIENVWFVRKKATQIDQYNIAQIHIIRMNWLSFLYYLDGDGLLSGDKANVDNSIYSNQAVDVAIDLGKKFNSKLTGNHVYAAKMHDYRFKQMEFTLPEEYLQEDELQKQRKIHDSLITMGLKLITDCYLDDMEGKCKKAGVELEKKMMDGKHHVEL